MGSNPVTRYVFNLDDINGTGMSLIRAAGTLGGTADSVRAAGRACETLPNVGPGIAQQTTTLARALDALERSLGAEGRWLSATAGRLAAVDAGVWAGASVAKIHRALRDGGGESGRHRKTGRLGRVTAVAADLFGEDVTGSKLPDIAARYYEAAKRLRDMSQRLPKPGAPPTPARRPAAPDLAERLAGDGRGLNRLKRGGTMMVPVVGSGAMTLADIKQWRTQEHDGLRGGFEKLRDSAAVTASLMHLGTDVLNVVPGAGTLADKGLDGIIFVALDGPVMLMDGADYLLFEKGNDIVHIVGDAGGSVLKGAADVAGAAAKSIAPAPVLNGLRSIGGLLP
ncbi:hypothetical protein AB0M79_25545 [Polymorphospora sp. NPDC051019]|uniref:hypothetical protein n=1 Tax=Polymorphospora sp. NPDC051019 TaxID=3155725 RepID=UPI003418C7E4